MSINQLTIDCLRLIRSENVGVKTFQSLISLYGSPAKALEAIPEVSKRGGRKKVLKVMSIAAAEKEIEDCKRKNAKIISIYDEEYPKLLKQISDYPPVITVYGNSGILNKPSISLVGSRNSSINGCKFTENLCKDLAKHKILSVSGLARGIDTAAHKGSLEYGTIAVVATGIDIIYPAQNKDLFKRIGEKGAVIAEMPYGSMPKAQNFPRRNRIISGMSMATIVVEANLRSGSLITARMALEQNREVFAVPGSPLDGRSEGTNKLIKGGASVLTSISDIIGNVSFDIDHLEAMQEQSDLFSQPTLSKAPDEDMLNKVRDDIISQIGYTPTLVDEIVEYTNYPTNIVVAVILELELAGRLERSFGNKVSLINI